MNEEVNKHDNILGTYFDYAENEVNETEKNITELVNSYIKTKESLEMIIERKIVFDKYSTLVSSNEVRDQSLYETANLVFIAGVVKTDDEMKFKRMIFRVSRARAITTFFDYLNSSEVNTDPTPKKIFTIFFPGTEEDQVLLNKILSVCDIFNVSRYNLKISEGDIMNEVRKLTKK